VRPSIANALCPVSYRPLLSAEAVSRVASGSQDPSCSVKASVEISSPEAMAGRYAFLAASSSLASSALVAKTALARYGPP
jgi:hypothetical protein